MSDDNTRLQQQQQVRDDDDDDDDDDDGTGLAAESELMESSGSLHQYFVSSAAADALLAGPSMLMSGPLGNQLMPDVDLDVASNVVVADTASGCDDFTPLVSVSPSKVSINHD